MHVARRIFANPPRLRINSLRIHRIWSNDQNHNINSCRHPDSNAFSALCCSYLYQPSLRFRSDCEKEIWIHFVCLCQINFPLTHTYIVQQIYIQYWKLAGSGLNWILSTFAAHTRMSTYVYSVFSVYCFAVSSSSNIQMLFWSASLSQYSTNKHHVLHTEIDAREYQIKYCWLKLFCSLAFGWISQQTSLVVHRNHVSNFSSQSNSWID